MDNKTHMMFHDEDVRAEGRAEGLKEGQAKGLKEGQVKGRMEGQTMTIKKTVAMLKQMNIPEAEIAHKIQQTFDLTAEQLADLLKQ